MTPGRIIALVLGILLALPGLGLLVGGAALTVGVVTQRDSDGFFEVTLDRVQTDAVAVTASDLAFTAEPGSSGWFLGVIDADVRLRVTVPADDGDVFVGIAREIDVDRYLDGVAHDVVIDLEGGRSPVYLTRPGADVVGAPDAETFWASSATGPGTQEVVWSSTSGRWAVVVMSADGEAGLLADVEVGVRVGYLFAVALTLLVAGLVVTAGAVALIVSGASGGRSASAVDDTTASGDAAVDETPPPIDHRHPDSAAAPAAGSEPLAPPRAGTASDDPSVPSS